MTPNEQLQSIFGFAFPDPVDDLTTLRQFHQPNAYCLDEAGRIMGISACENDFRQLIIPASLAHLQYLNLSDNAQLEQLSFEQPPTELRRLDVSDSALADFRLPAGCRQLNWLDLSRNQLTGFIPDGPAPRLSYLDLSGNQLRRFDADWLTHFPALKGLYLQGNALPELKSVFTDQAGSCLSDMEHFRQDLYADSDGQPPKNREYKVLVVGDGHVGKSCLVTRLIDDAFNEHHHSTQGIALRTYEYKDYRFNIWDFGGQDLYFATHRLFMQQQALYLALWDQYSQDHPTTPIKEGDRIQEYPNYKLPYWLDYIQAFGENSYAIAIKTKAKEDHRDHPERQRLRSKYHGLKFRKVDSKYPDQAEDDFDDLRKDLLRYFRKFDEGAEIPPAWQRIRTAIRQRIAAGDKTLSLTAFREMVAAAGVTDTEWTAHTVLLWLVQTGVVFYRSGYFQDQILLDQNWAIDAVYTIFDRSPGGGYYRIKSEQQEIHYFTGATLGDIWIAKHPDFSEQDQQLLIDFMQSCAICFEVGNEDRSGRPLAERRFVAPQFLRSDAPPMISQIRRSIPDAVYIRCRHELFHTGIIQHFIVRTSRLAKLLGIWQSGTVIEDPDSDAVALVYADYDRSGQKQDLYVQLPRTARSLRHKIRNLLDELQTGLKVREEVSLDGRFFVSLDKLRQHPGTHIDLKYGEATDSIPVSELRFFLEEDRQETFEAEQPTKGEKVIADTPSEKPVTVEAIKSLIASGELDEAATLCAQLSKALDKELYNQVIHQRGRLNNLNRQENEGIIEKSTAEVTRNQILKALTSLADEIDEQQKP